ncbi:DUF547 domain-containing protein [Poriferisphaera sp. WC338]|uniref:DUF547 domain-containing protein n=1 Tax=Poriferisphaera sp. WC338 TaxID=3425129 RepID=UPI003D81997E
MKHMTILGMVAVLVSGLFFTEQARGQTAVEDVSWMKQQGPELQTYNALLEKYVDSDGWVNYDGLSKEKDKLKKYVDSVAALDLDEMRRPVRLATLINAYNAFTLDLILEYWDDGKLKSIMDIPEDKRWDDVRWKIDGRLYSLNQIEHELIRPVFGEARIHFALVCAAYSCPKLLNKVYVGDRLEQQLQSQTEYAITHPRWYQYDQASNTVHLTKLFEWYGQDFIDQAGSVLGFVGMYQPEIKAKLEANDPPKIVWIEYDWKLNDISNKP